MDTLSEAHYFVTPIYLVQKIEFLEVVRAVSDRYLAQAREANKEDKRLTLMTGDYSHESELADFSQYVSQTAWNILQSQGYAMEKLVTFFTEMWTQEHNHMSSMDTHIHGAGAQVSAFFFLDAPDGGCNLVIHDPRPAKVITNMPQADDSKISGASNQVVFSPQAGTIIFSNAWTPHSFTRNTSDQPVRFVHMNLSVSMAHDQPEPQVEVI